MTFSPKLSLTFALSVYSLFATGNVVAGEGHLIQFDLPPVVPAWSTTEAPEDTSLVTVELRLSSMILTPTVPTIDQWVVRCQARDSETSIADYFPRTEAGSDVTTPIQVKQTDEQTQSLGMAVDGNYTNIARGKLGADSGTKKVNSVEYHRQAPLQAVTAAGTINRGRGVYFKLRWTSQQILEGEKVFLVTFAVPQHWRGSLLDVSVIAQSDRKTFGGFDRETQTIGAANFVVAAYRGGDEIAAQHAIEVADAEYMLRQAANQSVVTSSPRSLPSMLRHLAVKLDLEPSQPDDQWLGRLLVGAADPHLDKQITKLPMPIRIAALDYADSRDTFASLNRTDSSSTIRYAAAKPSVE